MGWSPCSGRVNWIGLVLERPESYLPYRQDYRAMLPLSPRHSLTAYYCSRIMIFNDTGAPDVASSDVRQRAFVNPAGLPEVPVRKGS